MGMSINKRFSYFSVCVKITDDFVLFHVSDLLKTIRLQHMI